MIESDPVTLPMAATDEAKLYLRIEQVEEDGVIGGLLRSAVQCCEGFTGQALIVRTVRETIPGGVTWRRLGLTPVRTIALVEVLGVDGVAVAADGYAIDVDARGDGWVRLAAAREETRVRVTYQAGIAADWVAVPAALRQGIIRLAGHLFAHRDAADDGGPPAAVAALWRPWRRMRL